MFGGLWSTVGHSVITWKNSHAYLFRSGINYDHIMWNIQFTQLWKYFQEMHFSVDSIVQVDQQVV